MGNLFAYTVGPIIGFLVALPIVVAMGIYQACVMVREKMKANKGVAKIEEDSIDAAETAEPEAKSVTSGSFRKHVDLGYATVDVWFHPDKRSASRTIRLIDKQLIGEKGEKLKLESVEYEQGEEDAIVEQAVAEAGSLLNKTNSDMRTTPQKRTSGTERRGGQQQGKKPLRARKAAKAEVTYSGEVIRFGMEERDGAKGSYDTFALHLFDTGAGAPHELCGKDLERAVKEAGVKPGDKVTVKKHGNVPVSLPNGETGYKNLWSVELI